MKGVQCMRAIHTLCVLVATLVVQVAVVVDCCVGPLHTVHMVLTSSATTMAC